MDLSKQLLCVVCPCYNEAEVIGLFYDALKPVLSNLSGIDHRIIFVDDGSTDETLETLNALSKTDPCVQVCALSRNFGHQIALTAGLDAASGDAVIMMDSDLQHPPTLIPRMIELWREGNDVVSAVRTCTADAGFLKRVSSNGFYTIVNWLSDTPIVNGASDFCLLSRQAHEALQAMPERHRFLRGMVSWIGFCRALVPYAASARAAGHSKYHLRKMIALSLDAVFSFSATPIKLGTRIGALTGFLGFIYLCYALGRYWLVRDLVPGWGSLISVILILGGMQLTFIGLIGEYLARVFEEVKNRPRYLLRQQPVERRFEVANGKNRGSLGKKKMESPT